MVLRPQQKKSWTNKYLYDHEEMAAALSFESDTQTHTVSLNI